MRSNRSLGKGGLGINCLWALALLFALAPPAPAQPACSWTGAWDVTTAGAGTYTSRASFEQRGNQLHTGGDLVGTVAGDTVRFEVCSLVNGVCVRPGHYIWVMAPDCNRFSGYCTFEDGGACVTTFSGVRAGAAPPAGNQAPEVALSHAPGNPGTQDTVQFFASASDPDGDTLSYAWYLDGVEQTVTVPNVEWATPPAGDHTMRVVVSDGRGGTAEDAVRFTVGERKRYVIAPGFEAGESEPYATVREVVVDGQADPGAAGIKLWKGTRLKTGPGVEIVIRFSNGAVVRVQADTEYELQERTRSKTSLWTGLTRLKEGVCEFYWPPGQQGYEKFQVETRRARVGIKGTRLTISELDGVTTVAVQEGVVEVEDLDTGSFSSVLAGQSARFDGSNDGGASIEAALDTNANGRLDDAEITNAIQHWILGTSVPGSGQTIGDAKMRELIQWWILGEPVSRAASQQKLASGGYPCGVVDG